MFKRVKTFYFNRYKDKKVDQPQKPIDIPDNDKSLCGNIWIEMLKFFVVAMMCLVWLGICIFVTEDF